MSDPLEHDPILDPLGAALCDAPGDPPPAFMALVRRRHRRAVAVRVGGTIITAAVIALVALAISLPLLRTPAPPLPIAHGPAIATERSIIPTAASVRRYIDDPTLLDAPLPAGAAGVAIRAGDREDSLAARALLNFN
jgi:hypothetical protein